MGVQLSWLERLHGMQKVTGSTPVTSTKGHPENVRNVLHINKSCPGGIYSFMNYIMYIIYSPSFNQFYIGHTSDLKDRLFRHNNSGSKSTKKTNDWIIKYTELFSSKAKAATRELEIKRKKSRKYIEWLISSAEQVNSKACGRDDLFEISDSPSR